MPSEIKKYIHLLLFSLAGICALLALSSLFPTNTYFVTEARLATIKPVDVFALEESIDILNLESKYRPSEILIKYKENMIDLSSVTGVLSSTIVETKFALSGQDYLSENNIVVAKILDGTSIYQKIVDVFSDPNVEYAQPNFKYHPNALPNDTHWNLLWGIDNVKQTVGGSYPVHKSSKPNSDVDIDGPEAWEIAGVQSDPVIVAVIDDGVAYNHPDLLGNMWNGANCKNENGQSLGGCMHGYNFAEQNKMPLPTGSSHGTHIAGTIAAIKNNSKGVVGVSPYSKIMALRMDGTTAQVIKAINFARHNNADIINFSWTYDGVELGSYFDKALYNTINTFPGIMVVAAGNGDSTGNGFNLDDGKTEHRSYPSGFRAPSPFGAGLSNLIVASALDPNDLLATFSNYGQKTVDIGAPGTNIYSTSAETEVTFETFDNAIPVGWTTSGKSGWEVVNKVLWGDTAIPYVGNVNSTLTSKAYNLSGNSTSAVIGFVAACDTEYTPAETGDYMSLEFSSDGIQFDEVMRWNEYVLDQIVGDYSDVGSALYRFDALPIQPKYLTSNFKLRFRWVTNSTDNNYNGCYIDTLKITKISDGSEAQYTYLSGTSMAAPMVTGTVALLKGYQPNLTTSELRTIITTSGDPVSALSLKSIFGKRVNAFNALSSVSGNKIEYNTGTMYESPLNNGSIETIITIQLSGDTFVTGLKSGQHILFQNIPQGLVPVVQRISNTTVNISFSGSAVEHAISNNTEIGIQFTDTAFTGGDAKSILQSNRNDIAIRFYDPGEDIPTTKSKRGVPQLFEQ